MEPERIFTKFFGFYGVRVKLNTDSEFIAENINRDFSYFQKEFIKKSDIEVFSFHKEPPYHKVPELKASLYKDNAICYNDKNIRYIDYHGKALAIYDFRNNIIEIYSQDLNFLWELTYLAILSRVGEELDKKGMHRIHALGISVNNKAVLIILPMGGGKTTLGLELLKYDDVKLLSDDTPLITRDGKVLPFPIRIGVCKEAAFKLNIPQQYLRNFTRSKYGPKVLIDIDYFKDKISSPCKLAVVFIGERLFSSDCQIHPISRMKAIMPFIIHGAIGLGLPQLIEYFISISLKDIFSKIRITLSRVWMSLSIIRHISIYRFMCGNNVEKNASVLKNQF